MSQSNPSSQKERKRPLVVLTEKKLKDSDNQFSSFVDRPDEDLGQKHVTAIKGISFLYI